MLVEGVYLYIMVITVFESSKEQLRIYGTCAYGKAFNSRDQANQCKISDVSGRVSQVGR